MVNNIWAAVTMAVLVVILFLLVGCAHVKETKTTYYDSGNKQSEESTEKYGVLFSEGKEISLIKIN